MSSMERRWFEPGRGGGCNSCVRVRTSWVDISDHQPGAIGSKRADAPEKPYSRSVETVFRTCSRHGEKQQILVITSGRSTLIACGIASHGAGRSRKTSRSA